ncbi:MAG: tRNA uridine(34) 5-carboxymethylaminomethyl modification radical SAM/GNAT enzyme Elp3 [Candidatus Heimdallarchaeota archaeon]|nr:tRNA uridine(34) 5-carboxymethylaminomethyl modification radical SAM/GNAT enzyme Elp3 [Candidatus Heimdallarchaeota archaeon]
MATKSFSDEVPRELTAEEQQAYQEIINHILAEKPDKKMLETIKRDVAKKYGLAQYPRNSDLLKQTPKEKFEAILPYLRVRNVRSLSGVNVISVFTAPFSCSHGTCIYCPGGPAWGTPQSYTGREPGAMRAISNGFDPVAQLESRIDQLIATGHNSQKLDVIIMGGTFNATPREYQDQFILGVYEGMNGKPSDSLQEAQKLNETATHRCIGLTIETKPDWALPKHIRRMLNFGTTRVEIGVQTLREDILQRVNRGHSLQDTIDSFKAMRDAGLKITAHMMPGLPGSSPEMDIEDFRTLYYDPRFIPDEMKIYPTQVIENTQLAQLVVNGEYKGLSNEDTFRIIKEAKLMTPPFVRIKRALRDLPIPMVIDGPTWGDMRHRIQKELNDMENLKCRCIRCREVGLNAYKQDVDVSDLGDFEKVKRSYEAGDGMEHFLSYENKDEWLTGFLRLRYPSEDVYIDVLKDAAIVRELHVYGSALEIDQSSDKSFQHKGYGRKLLQWAEEMAKDAGYKHIAVISGVGVREYYRKFGYQLKDVYMIKQLE